MAVNGGAPQALFDVKALSDFHCTNRAANFCVYDSRTGDGRELVMTAFDPVSGERRELLRIPTEPGAFYRWAPSSDGSQLAILKNDWNANQIRFIPVGGGETRTVTVKGYVNSLDWVPDSKSLFVGTFGPPGAVLLRIDLNGDAQPVWHQPQPTPTWGILSPDGRHLAILGSSTQ